MDGRSVFFNLTFMAFDEFGNLIPYAKNELTIQQAEKEFVEDFAPENEVRTSLWINLATYNARLKALFRTTWDQWIDGSFVTSKRAPNDLDLVNLIKYSDELNKILGEKLAEGAFLFSMEKGKKSRS
jgi:hypothetical protein